MSEKKQLEYWNFGLDYPFVIIGAHLSVDEAREQFGKDYDEEICEDEPAIIDEVRHVWIRYEIIGEDNCPDDYDPDPGERMWLLHDQTQRPKGVVRRATVVNPL